MDRWKMWSNLREDCLEVLNLCSYLPWGYWLGDFCDQLGPFVVRVNRIGVSGDGSDHRLHHLIMRFRSFWEVLRSRCVALVDSRCHDGIG